MPYELIYFAYGSNLLRERLTARCPGIKLHGTASLPGHRLTFDQLSTDGSGKGAFEPARGDALPGVLWSVPENELNNLDLAEGAGIAYARHWVGVVDDDGENCRVLTYRPLNPHKGALPFDWYLALVLAGAKQHGLPGEHIDRIQHTPCTEDRNPDATGGRKGLAALRSADMLQTLKTLQALQ